MLSNFLVCKYLFEVKLTISELRLELISLEAQLTMKESAIRTYARGHSRLYADPAWPVQRIAEGSIRPIADFRSAMQQDLRERVGVHWTGFARSQKHAIVASPFFAASRHAN